MEGAADHNLRISIKMYYYLYFLPFVSPTDPKYKGMDGRFISFHNFVK